jgi:hypothetical protein
MSIFGPNHFSIENMAKSFANTYYRNVMNSGWDANMYLYELGASCAVNGRNISYRALASHMASGNVRKAVLTQPMMSYILVGDALIVNVTCKMSFTNYSGYHIKSAFVSDNFIVSMQKRRILVHSMHIRNDMLRRASIMPDEWDEL